MEDTEGTQGIRQVDGRRLASRPETRGPALTALIFGRGLRMNNWGTGQTTPRKEGVKRNDTPVRNRRLARLGLGNGPSRWPQGRCPDHFYSFAAPGLGVPWMMMAPPHSRQLKEIVMDVLVPQPWGSRGTREEWSHPLTAGANDPTLNGTDHHEWL